MGRVLAAAALALLVSACDKSASSDKPAEKASGLGDGFTEVPNVDGLQAKVPAALEPNGIGGAAGFHAKTGKLSVMIREVTADDAKKPLDEAKKGVEEVMFKKWISSDKTPDGWVLQWEAEQIEGMGASHSYEVRKTVGTKTFTCYGGGESAAEIATGVEVCKSLKAR